MAPYFAPPRPDLLTWLKNPFARGFAYDRAQVAHTIRMIHLVTIREAAYDTKDDQFRNPLRLSTTEAWEDWQQAVLAESLVRATSGMEWRVARKGDLEVFCALKEIDESVVLAARDLVLRRKWQPEDAVLALLAGLSVREMATADPEAVRSLAGLREIRLIPDCSPLKDAPEHAGGLTKCACSAPWPDKTYVEATAS